jgi:plastocyanin
MRRSWFLILLAGAATTAALAKGSAHVVEIDGVKYAPATLTVTRGDTVTWVNKDPFPHTVTARGAFDSGDIPAGAKWTFVARKPGTYGYICTYHPNMKGVLKVE